MPLVFSRYGFYDKGDTLASLVGGPVGAAPDDGQSSRADCGLWLWRSDEPLEELSRCAALAPEDIAAYDAVSSESRRREFLTVRVMAASVLGQSVYHRDNGAPFLSGDSRRISFSHTSGFVAMALDRKPVGVDVEVLSRDVSRVADRVFTGEERAVADDVTLWCAKEAVYKACGREGVDFRRDIRILHRTGEFLAVFAFGGTIRVKCLSLDGLMVAVTL